MADHVFIVLSEPPADLPEDEFHAWYDRHVREILELPGFVAAERFKIGYVRGNVRDPDTSFSHYVRYEIEGEFEVAWQALRAAVDGGRIYLSDWFPQVITAGWVGTSLGGRIVAA